jgi:hypothetical protein
MALFRTVPSLRSISRWNSVSGFGSRVMAGPDIGSDRRVSPMWSFASSWFEVFVLAFAATALLLMVAAFLGRRTSMAAEPRLRLVRYTRGVTGLLVGVYLVGVYLVLASGLSAVGLVFVAYFLLGLLVAGVVIPLTSARLKFGPGSLFWHG